MEQQEQNSTQPTLEDVRRELEQWRRTRPKQGPLPEHFWGAAVSLARLGSSYQVARTLRLNYDALKMRMGERPSAKTRLARRSPPSSTRVGQFIELSPLAAPTRPSSESAMVEVVAPDGARLTIRFKAAGPDLLALVAAFQVRG